jgi:prepilin-type N-terminal cleavage/methylation domain-containing protein
MIFPLERLTPCARIGLKKQPEKGFTLVELMIVLGCIAIIAAVAQPPFLNFLRDTGLKQAVYQLSGDLYRAKSQAVQTHTVQTVNLDKDANTYVCTNSNRTINLENYWGNPTFTTNPGEEDPDAAFSRKISFNARGLSATTQAYLTANGRTFRVQVSAAGAVSINEWRDGKWIQ